MIDWVVMMGYLMDVWEGGLGRSWDLLVVEGV